MSGWKRLLCLIVATAILNVLAALTIGAIAATHSVPAPALAAPLKVIVSLALLTFGLAILGMVEYAGVVFHSYDWKHDPGFTPSQVSAALAWCPRPLRTICLVGGISGGAAVYATGPAQLGAALDLTYQTAVAFCAVSCGFGLLGLPLLISVARMPGTFRDNLSIRPSETPN